MEGKEMRKGWREMDIEEGRVRDGANKRAGR